MEVDLASVWRQGRIAITVSLSGIVIPFAVGTTTAWYAGDMLAREPGSNHLVFALFFATALSISALPVIAKTLMDLNLFRTDLGMIVIAAAIFEDFAGWIIFAVILGMLGMAAHGMPVAATIGLTLAFALFMLTAGRWLIHRALPWVQAHASWPGGVLGFTLALTFACAAFTEWVGVHAVFGAFMAGVAMGDSDHLRERTRQTIDQFVSFIFAPIFFASIGLRVNFLAHFDLAVVLTVLGVACVGKVMGCALGARLAGMSPRQSLALGFGMNARGAMEIILGMLGLQFGLIGERLFVALVIMALITSVISGPAMQRILRRKSTRLIRDYLSEKTFVAQLQASTREAAIAELAALVAPLTPMDAIRIESTVLLREYQMATGIGHRVAVPNGRFAELKAPLVAVGLVAQGIDFQSPDGQLARVIFMLLTPRNDEGAQIELIADIAQNFRLSSMRAAPLEVATFTEFLALLRTGEGKAQRHGA